MAPGDEILTVDLVAGQLKLHPKTVLRFIREGRLRAVRVGKAYRISRKDLEAFTGLPAETAPAAAPATVTCIVDIPGVEPDRAQAWGRTIPAALNANDASRPPVRADVIYDPERAHLKIVLVSSPEVAGGLLKLVQFLLEQWGR